jgi:hypothetical protein
MGLSGGNNMDKQEEEFADLMDMDFSTDVEPPSDGEFKISKKCASGGDAKVHSHHYKLSLQEYKTHHYKQTNMKGKKAQPKLQDQVAEKKKDKEMGGKK